VSLEDRQVGVRRPRLTRKYHPYLLEGPDKWPRAFTYFALAYRDIRNGTLMQGAINAPKAARLFQDPKIPGFRDGDWLSKIPIVSASRLSAWRAWVLLAIALTFSNDTGAYFAGHAFGRHKLLPRVSPSKTWEGFFGGMLASIGTAFVVRALGASQLSTLDCLALGVVVSILGPLGDLAESLLKRSMGVKDSGRLIPGHGGLLDRIDALIFTAPWAYFYASRVKGVLWP
jgi:hypothetical protein